MDKVKKFIAGKGIGFWFVLATFVLMILALIFYCTLIGSSYEPSETPAAVIACTVICFVLCLAAGWKDFFHVITLAGFLAAALALCFFIAGRVSYVAYYISGDVMGTGLSPMFVLTAVCLVLGVITSACAVCFRQDKKAPAQAEAQAA